MEAILETLLSFKLLLLQILGKIIKRTSSAPFRVLFVLTCVALVGFFDVRVQRLDVEFRSFDNPAGECSCVNVVCSIGRYTA